MATNDAEPVPVGAADPSPANAAPVSTKRLVEAWQDLKMNFAVLMGAFKADAAWLGRLEAASESVRVLLAQDADVALYLLLQTATHEIEHYSSHHAMLCAAVSHLCSAWFDWPVDERRSLFAAALTMNIGMQSVQDAMAKQSSPPSQDQRRRIDEHPVRSAELLRSAGVTDGLWIDVVLRHHQPIDDRGPSDPLQASQRLALLLHRIDVFTAKLSRRQSRTAASATVAAREACLDASGYPDATGATILRILGLYPPGSYVRLVNAELAVVTRRGSKAHAPVVASLRRADGTPFARPLRRDTGDRAYAVERSAKADELKIVVNHERVLAA